MVNPMSDRRPKRLTVTLETDVAAAMRDGTVLRSDMYRPDRAGKYPVLLARTLLQQAD